MIRRPPRSTLFPYTTLFRSEPGDVVVIAGKGHEQGQEFENARKEPFDDVTVAREALRAALARDRKSTRLNSSHANISYAVFCLKKKKHIHSHTCFAHHFHTL